MIAQTIARAIQHMEISSLELTTVAFVLCTTVTFIFWIDKTQGVERAFDLETQTPFRTILAEAGQIARAPYADTPMDFVEQPGWSQWRRRPIFSHVGIPVRPLQRIPNDYAVAPQILRLPVPLWFLTVAHASCHILARNFPFPTNWERWLWRGSSVTISSVMLIWGFAEVMSVKPGFDLTMTLLGIWEKRASKNTRFRNWAADGPGTMSTILYGLARTFLIIETFASLRSMEPSVYYSVDWAQFIPHF
ncbi:hypothetical protein WAI453_005542 [Rhynchosporium graminicola]